MSEDDFRVPVGTIGWTDLTVGDATTLRDFYAAVAGWTFEPVEMEGYEDFTMRAPGEEDPVAGICHARGPNADVPPQWMIYITVADLDAALAACTARGGSVVGAVRDMGEVGRFAIIRDPAGAVAGLFEAAPAD